MRSLSPTDAQGQQTAPVAIEELSARAFKVPTDHPEADGTLSWDATTMVLVRARAAGETGLGFSYTSAAAAKVVEELLADAVKGGDALSPQASWLAMRRAVRNAGYPGVIASAISAVDVALWDLKARLLGVPLSVMLGPLREGVPIYGSGGFTSYTDKQLQRQLDGWAQEGIGRVKMKVGSEPERDPQRVRLARATIGEEVELFVDANGAYERKQALALAQAFVQEAGVRWFEEPVSSDDLEGLALLRARVPAPMQVAAGEYGYELFYFKRMLDAGAVDVLQADVTRCGGITAMLQVDALCAAQPIPLSAHTSPSIHAHVGCALERLVHVEFFHDHARIERMLFEGAPEPREGLLCPPHDRPGLGLELKESDAERYEI
jgi:L-alanine-DL-glutamate epimerase-like enolase superfamily enzyme